MRYWWRAALGGVIGDKNLKGLHELEGAVFGSTEQASPIGLRLKALDIQKTKVDLLPHKSRFIPSRALDGTFELILTQPRHDDALVWDAACASLELALTFGGVGQRSRRGYGALQIVEASNDKVRVFATTRRGWEFHVKRVTKQAIEAVARLTIEKFPDFRWARAQNLADYPCATNAGMIRLYDWSEPTAMEAVKRFMRRTKEHRAFGGANPRQASPLWMRPIQIGNSYGLLCTVLTSDFRGANYDYLGNFLENLGGESLNVKGWNTL
jgi:CRISPR-associated protein Cmr1